MSIMSITTTVSSQVSSGFAALPLTERPPFAGAQLTANMWVRLLQPPTDFSFDEAWLLCQEEQDRWQAWVPDYGSIVLDSTAIAPL